MSTVIASEGLARQSLAHEQVESCSLRSVRREQAGDLFYDQLGVFTAQQPTDEKDDAQQHVDDVIHFPKHQQ